jgi:hypothetical protein
MSIILCVLVLFHIYHYRTHYYHKALVHVSNDVRNISITSFLSIKVHQVVEMVLSVIHLQFSSVRASINLDLCNPIMYFVSWFLH